jgi:glucosyl-3-phosphoglycerate synthase
MPRIVVLGVVEVPADQPLTTGMDMARSYRALFDFLPSEVDAGGRHVRVDRLVKVARDVPTAVRQAVEEEHAGLVLAHWKGHPRNPKLHVYGHILDDLLRDPPCDIILTRPDGWRDCGRVLLPVRGGPSAEQALDVALLLAEQGGMHLAVMHNVPASRSGTGPLSQGLLKKTPTGPLSNAQVAADVMETGPYVDFNEYLETVGQAASVQIERIATVSESATAAVLGEVQPEDLVIMGVGAFSERGGKSGQAGASTLPATVAANTKAPILLLRTRETLNLAKYASKAQVAHVRNAWTDMPFEYWFVENTYHGDEFRDPDEFLKLKQATGLSISVGLLTSNDARHLRSMITGLRRVLMEMHPLADQIAVVDAGSGDETLEIARSLGVEVYSAPEILPDEGSLHGRGESWWKSLAVLRGDIVVWLDPRATRFHPSAALALAGPLLRNANLQLVKAFSLTQHDPHGAAMTKEQEGRRGEGTAPLDVSWGGFVVPKRDGAWPFARRIRVQALKPSDLAALTPAQFAALPPRTILQVLSSSLAGVVDPFGRDYAARRDAMLSIPVFSGPNLELGMLLSVTSHWGSRALAQVELRHAQPAPPPQPGLPIAIDVLQVLAHRLEDDQLAGIASEIAARLQAELQGPTGPDSGIEVRALNPVERPPMSTVLGA